MLKLDITLHRKGLVSDVYLLLLTRGYAIEAEYFNTYILSSLTFIVSSSL